MTHREPLARNLVPSVYSTAPPVSLRENANKVNAGEIFIPNPNENRAWVMTRVEVNTREKATFGD